MTRDLIISLDLETYGMVKWLPQQTVFNPVKGVMTDRCPPLEMIRLVSITEVHGGPLRPEEWDLRALSRIRPGPTRVFKPSEMSHVKWVREWIGRAHTVVGVNPVFDWMMLTFDPRFRRVVWPLPFTVDLIHLIYLENELRPERSLKSIGNILGTHSYEDPRALAARHGEERYESDDDESFVGYAAEDTVNPVVAISALANRILERFKGEPL